MLSVKASLVLMCAMLLQQCMALSCSGTSSAQSPFAVQSGTITAMFQSTASDIIVSNQIGVPFNISINGMNLGAVPNATAVVLQNVAPWAAGTPLTFSIAGTGVQAAQNFSYAASYNVIMMQLLVNGTAAQPMLSLRPLDRMMLMTLTAVGTGQIFTSEPAYQDSADVSSAGKVDFEVPMYQPLPPGTTFNVQFQVLSTLPFVGTIAPIVVPNGGSLLPPVYLSTSYWISWNMSSDAAKEEEHCKDHLTLFIYGAFNTSHGFILNSVHPVAEVAAHKVQATSLEFHMPRYSVGPPLYIYEMDSLVEVTYNSTEIILQMPMLQPTNTSVTFQFVPCIELLTVGDIVGLVIGVVAALLILVVGLAYLVQYRKRQRELLAAVQRDQIIGSERAPLRKGGQPFPIYTEY